MRRTWMLGVCAILATIGPACSGDGGAEAVSSTDEPVDGCSSRTEVILWTESSWLMPVAQHLTPNLPCTHYYLGVPLEVADKTRFHANVAEEIAHVHALGSNFHALAEFEWGAWRNWIAESPGTRDWHSAGVEFRKRMDAAGFEIASGNSDTWLINEFPSTMLESKPGADKAETRAHAVSAVTGLFDGGAVRKKGVIARTGVGSTPFPGMPEYKALLEDFLSDAPFWRAMNRYVRWWGEEVYADPHDVCVGTATVADRARHLNDYLFHTAKLAEAGLVQAAEARAFFRKTFTPFLNGAWMTDGGYGDVRITEPQMSAFLSQQVYSVRAFAEHDYTPAGRMAWSWSPDNAVVSQTDVDALGKRLASAIDGAYARGAAYACSPSGAYTYCQCDVPGATFDERWHDMFGAW